MSRSRSPFFVGIVLASLAALSPLSAQAEITHVVVKGQTLGRIAKRYRTTVDAIREANGLRIGQAIKPGLSLAIPEKGDAPAKAAHSGRPTRVAKADTGKAADFIKKPKRPGFVHLERGTERIDVQLLGRHGRLNGPALAQLSRLFRSKVGSQSPIDPRLAALLGTLSDHFGGRRIHIVSGFRPYTPTQFTPHSNHNFGRAVDFYVEGVPNKIVRDFCRTFRNAGVGYYPNSSFVHLDARQGKAFWVDFSGPGEAPRYESPNDKVNADEAARDVDTNPPADAPHDHGADAPSGSSVTP